MLKGVCEDQKKWENDKIIGGETFEEERKGNVERERKREKGREDSSFRCKV